MEYAQPRVSDARLNSRERWTDGQRGRWGHGNGTRLPAIESVGVAVNVGRVTGD